MSNGSATRSNLTESCDADTPHLITNVETTPAASPDDTALAVVHASLAAAGRLPAEHLVDKGYTDSHVLVDSQRSYGITIIGPVADDPSWQAQASAGFAKADFVIDWEARTATCPARKQSLSWLIQPGCHQTRDHRRTFFASGLLAVPFPCPMHAASG